MEFCRLAIAKGSKGYDHPQEKWRFYEVLMVSLVVTQ
jgi:hypothetical protein